MYAIDSSLADKLRQPYRIVCRVFSRKHTHDERFVKVQWIYRISLAVSDFAEKQNYSVAHVENELIQFLVESLPIIRHKKHDVYPTCDTKMQDDGIVIKSTRKYVLHTREVQK